MTLQTEIIAEITAFLDRTGLSETRLGLLAVRDGSFVPRLREGRVTVNSCNRLLAFMASYETDSGTRGGQQSSETGS